jgi:hypothetical protein
MGRESVKLASKAQLHLEFALVTPGEFPVLDGPLVHACGIFTEPTVI